MTARRAIAASPVAPAVALALAALVVMGVSEGGYFPGDWYPAAFYTLALAAIAFLLVPAGRAPARPVVVACLAFAAYAAWSYLSIGWADQKGEAWEGANRTALYAVLFALCALWPIRGRVAALLVSLFALAVAALAAVTLVRAAWAASPTSFFIDGRLAEPIAYPSGDAGLWSMAFWPCVVFGSRREAPPELRAVFVAAAVMLGSVALMGQSRGWLFALPVVAVVFLAVTPGRVRTALGLLLVLAGIGVTIPAVLDVYDKRGQALDTAFDGAANSVIAAAVVAGAIAALAAVADRRRRVSRAARRRAGAALLVLALALLSLGAGVYVAERGSPFSDVADAWDEFKTKGNPRGGPGAESRLGRLGSNRYDFWRVAANNFADAPLHGIGADNFRAAYLRDARSTEQPRYPHSLEFRTLSQTGLVGAALLAVAFGAALVAAGRAMRQRAGPGAAAAAACVGAFIYWLVHGSVDWFWELPVLGGAAFALLGIAAGLAPRGGPRQVAPLARGRVGVAVALGAGLLLTASFGAPALSERYVSRAQSVYPRDADEAFDQLDRAAALNPISTRPKVIAGRVALELDRPRDAVRYFREALEREPDAAYTHLQLGAVLFDSGSRAEGLRILERAARLAPRAPVTRLALTRARAGRRIDVDAINRELIARGRELVR